MLRHKPWPCGGGPGQRDAVHGCDRGRRVVFEADRRRDAKHFAGRYIAHHDLLALGSGLFSPDVSVKEQKERVGLLALFEDIRILGVPDGAGFLEKLIQLRGIKPREERQVSDQ